MTESAPRVAWPAPCLPVLLEDEHSFPCLLAAGGGDLAAQRRWAADLRLRRRDDGCTFALETESAEIVEEGSLGAEATALAALPEWRGCLWLRLILRRPTAAAARDGRRAAVFDLTHAGDTVRAGAVGVLAPGRRDLRLAFASDIHVAGIWDDLEEAVRRHAADLAPSFLQPNRLLETFVRHCNALAAAGELDLVVFGGDLVDHVYTAPRERASRAAGATNVRRFADLVAALEVPALAVPGNHDYRLFPWRPRLPTLQQIGIPGRRTAAILKAAGLWDRLPLRLSDRDALTTRDEVTGSALAHHLALLAPATDFVRQARGLRLLFASTGRDVWVRWRDLEWSRRVLLPRTLPTTLEHPDSEGLHDHQVAAIGAALDGTPAALFLHAPVLHTGRPAAIESKLDRLDPGDRDDLAARVDFERRLLRAGVRRGVLYRNPGPLLRALTGSAAPAALFAGHIHRGTAAFVDRRTMAVRSAAVSAPDDAGAVVPLYTAPSLGQMRDRPEESEPPGFLLARFEGGRLAALEQRALLAAASC